MLLGAWREVGTLIYGFAWCEFFSYNEPAQQAFSYYTIHDFWAHVPFRHFCFWKWAYLSHIT
jgi:hypothetical protein